MNIQFLWDEEKTRKLFKSHLLLFLIGGVLASVYALILPANVPYHLVIVLLPILFTLSCPIYLLTLNKPGVGMRFLVFTLEAQLAASVFMAVTGGFLGIVQFAPYMFLLFAVFELGTDATLILGAFSLATFVGILFWTLNIQPEPNTIKNFIYYVGSYFLILLIERNIGNELSLQFEAKKRLEVVDDLKNQFMALTSHYLRTPLTVIKGFAQLMEKTDLQGEQKQYLDQIRTSSHTLETLIEKILLISNIERGNAKITTSPTDLSEMLTSIAGSFQDEAKDHQVTLLYQPSSVQLPVMQLDRVSMRDILVELVDNAIKFNKPNGSVTIAATADQTNVSITISDTGKGIGKEHLEHLFTPFNRGSMDQTLKYGASGVGLSLYLAKLITEAHGGKLDVSSTENIGTTFTMTLPLKA